VFEVRVILLTVAGNCDKNASVTFQVGSWKTDGTVSVHLHHFFYFRILFQNFGLFLRSCKTRGDFFLYKCGIARAVDLVE